MFYNNDTFWTFSLLFFTHTNTCITCTYILALTTLRANSADGTGDIFLIFPRKKDLTGHANLHDVLNPIF